MSIPILVEPTYDGFRATAGGPFNLSSEAASAGEAVSAVKSRIDARIRSGAVLFEHTPWTEVSVDNLSLATHPMFEDFLKSVAEYRDEKEAQDQLIYGAE